MKTATRCGRLSCSLKQLSRGCLEVFTLKYRFPNRPVMARDVIASIRTKLAIWDSGPRVDCFPRPVRHPIPAGTAAVTHASTPRHASPSVGYVGFHRRSQCSHAVAPATRRLRRHGGAGKPLRYAFVCGDSDGDGPNSTKVKQCHRRSRLGSRCRLSANTCLCRC